MTLEGGYSGQRLLQYWSDNPHGIGKTAALRYRKDTAVFAVSQLLRYILFLANHIRYMIRPISSTLVAFTSTTHWWQRILLVP